MPRRDDLPPLVRDALAPDPFAQLEEWWELARREVPLPEAMTLATADADGAPNARMVLLKGFSSQGLSFFSNYESVKGDELAANPRAALILYWRELDRQVRVRGAVERLPDGESDAYFASRPRESQIGAHASDQSRPVEREALEERFAELLREFDGKEVPRPEHWGGYLLRPESIEFWQGRDNRMHDRFRYTRDGGGWRIERLSP
ncbi:MAG TPA: pyridoxamine 5'-phosphate oxidase [Solirubrobacterales bacterium]|nr:pyridoxamine 5'-phosphate oxidase [Solirubrobacterales bacterium]